MTASTEKSPKCWAFDAEHDSPLVAFDDQSAADGWIMRQNAHQGRDRWLRIEDETAIADRVDGTPALLPSGCRISIAGHLVVSCAEALEIAGALAHAVSGRRRIAGLVIATPVDDRIHLEVDAQGTIDVREWRMDRRAARTLAVRLATIAAERLAAPDGDRR